MNIMVFKKVNHLQVSLPIEKVKMKSTQTVTKFPLESSVGRGDLNALFSVLDKSL